MICIFRMSWIPGISQLKSVVQLVTGDVEGALETQVLDVVCKVFSVETIRPSMSRCEPRDGDGIRGGG